MIFAVLPFQQYFWKYYSKKDCCILPSSVFIVAYIDAAIVLGDYKLLILCFVLNLNLQESNLVKERVDLAICIEKVAWLLDKGPLVGEIRKEILTE